jgi:hypothetical protein
MSFRALRPRRSASSCAQSAELNPSIICSSHVRRNTPLKTMESREQWRLATHLRAEECARCTQKLKPDQQLPPLQ